MHTDPRPNPATPAERLAAARQRVEASRSRLIHTLYPDPPDTPRSPAAGGAPGRASTGPPLGAWARALGADQPWPAVRRLALRWWQRQPWHASVQLVAGTLAQQARPLVRRHPWAALVASAVAGALLVSAGPWLLRGARRQAEPLRRQLVGSLWATLGSASVQVALAGALAAWLERHSRPEAAPAGEPAARPPDAEPP